MRTDGIITPIIPFEDSAEAYRAIDERPQESIKLGIRFWRAVAPRAVRCYPVRHCM